MTDVLDRALPSSLDAERAVLGAVLMNDRQWLGVAAALKPEDFYRDAHRRIFVALRELADAGVMFDFLTLKEQLGATGELDEVGGPAYLTALTDGMVSGHAEDYARIVREKARLRALVILGNRMAADAYDEMAAREVVERNVRQLLGLASTEVRGPIKVKAAIDAYMRAMQEGTAVPPLPTGFRDLDGLIGGFQPEDLVIVAARPSVGKSTFSLMTAYDLAVRGIPVAFFSLEMSTQQLGETVLSWRSGVSSHMLRFRRASDADQARVGMAWAELPDLPLYLHDAAPTLTGVAAWVRRMRDEHGIQAAFVDYLQMMLVEERSQSRQEDVAALSRGLKAIARENHVTLIALSQLKRAPDGRPKADKRPHLSDLRESGALEQDADLAVLLYRPEMDQKTEANEGLAEVIVAKHRMGPTGVIKLYFYKALAKFCDLALPE